MYFSNCDSSEAFCHCKGVLDMEIRNAQYLLYFFRCTRQNRLDQQAHLPHHFRKAADTLDKCLRGFLFALFHGLFSSICLSPHLSRRQIELIDSSRRYSSNPSSHCRQVSESVDSRSAASAISVGFLSCPGSRREHSVVTRLTKLPRPFERSLSYRCRTRSKEKSPSPPNGISESKIPERVQAVLARQVERVDRVA